ncbi:FHA domain-containing protein [Streptomyces sp. SID8382]|uniref:FHA domain-containing protein n=1 Tax=Streptomyces malaysiensis TaxID=92644 RepID=UPI000C2BED67|nr:MULTISPECIES: FHA domain-containing protein [unclassified Streptomyces]AUA15940.1 FHA domain protein [Streptomyces sp. M56]MYX56041.1 FHA domain-containing protein [Streptomyces sp. SID8382]
MSEGTAPPGWWREPDDEEAEAPSRPPEASPPPEAERAEKTHETQEPDPLATSASGPAPGPDGVEVSAPCWNCRAPVAPRDTRCASCGRARTHVLLVCSEPCLELRHGPGPPLRLGRHADWAPRTAAAFAGWNKVSRRHVSITVEPDGTAWAEEPEAGSRNGTYLNGARIAAGVRTPVRDGDQLRLGLRISFTVRLYGPGPGTG